MFDFNSTLKALGCDVLCVQETRLGPSDPDLGRFALIPGHSAYFSFCRPRTGYSGVATFVRDGGLTPRDAGEGLLNAVGGAAPQPDESDSGNEPAATRAVFDMVLREGRAVVTDHGRFVLLNMYVPASGGDLERASFRVAMLRAAALKATALRAAGRHVVLVGDFNVVPTLADTSERIAAEHRLAWHNSPSRASLRALCKTADVVDGFRRMHPRVRNAFTCWSTATRSRELNAGVRIDYVLLARALADTELRDAAVHANVTGSDHAPTSVTLEHSDYESEIGPAPPPFCAKNLPGLAVKQASVVDLFRGTRRSQNQAPTPPLLPVSSIPGPKPMSAPIPHERSGEKSLSREEARPSSARVEASLQSSDSTKSFAKPLSSPPPSSKPRLDSSLPCPESTNPPAPSSSPAFLSTNVGFDSSLSCSLPTKPLGTSSSPPPLSTKPPSTLGSPPHSSKRTNVRSPSPPLSNTNLPVPPPRRELILPTAARLPIDLPPARSSTRAVRKRPRAENDVARSGTQSRIDAFFRAPKREAKANSELPVSTKVDDETSPPASQYSQPTQSKLNSNWARVFGKAAKAPRCKHGEPCVLKTVNKTGPNRGRTFWSCARPGGRKGDAKGDCGFFEWAPYSASKPLPTLL